MLPAHPPHSWRISPIWNDTDSTRVWSGRMCREKRSGNTMIVSRASDPQISVRGAILGSRKGLLDRESKPRLLRQAVSRADREFDREVAGSSRRLAADFAHDELLPARHRQRLGDAAQQDFPVRVAVGADAALESPDRFARDQAIAMDANEALPEFLLEAGQRLLEQELAIRGPDGDVLELCLQIDDFLDRHQHDPRSFGHRQESARRGRQPIELSLR